MARRPAPPSGMFGGDAPPPAAAPGRRPPAAAVRGRRERRARPPRRQVDVREWLGGIRLSGFMVVMLGLVVLAAFVLMPTFGTFVQQRQRIAALEQSVQAGQDEVEQLEAQRERWSDPAYITTQARERLYYVRPGEVVYLVQNDLDEQLQPTADEPVSADITQTRTDWMSQLLASVTAAGVAGTIRPAP
ncbi:septum formation initiator family protein [Microbacterium sp. LRZ72]|uniref:FtsB family cell division protein n=1 Tax=Microbacterium sp. LRZ72 TaxID=2942481 RepID=UPI0029B2EBCB|nr:septum formation initiator family protein [Microbacterium sp. LRZ72]MDX2375823.1 septum formation initiator family protein [Microbacterium sp. LRZ72]